MPRILLTYIGRQYLFWFLGLLLILSGVIGVFELIELLRRMSGRETASFGAAVGMAALKLPQTVDRVFHFTVLFSAMFTFWRLTRSQELVIMRTSGLSAWQFIFPVIAAAMAIGVVKTTVYNPIAAQLFARYERLESTYLGAGADSFKISPGGLWLRQPIPEGMAVIHAARADPASMELQRVVVLRFDEGEHFVDRIDAETMHLEAGFWRIERALVTTRTIPSVRIDTVDLPTTLTRESIQERFSSPETTGFWDLPDYIKTLEETGFTAVRYRLAHQAMLSQPLLLAAMVLFAAAFSLRHPRRGRTLLMVGAGMTTGFVLLMLTDIVTAYGIAQTIPVPMAAWTPALVSLLVGTATLLHLEDG